MRRDPVDSAIKDRLCYLHDQRYRYQMAADRGDRQARKSVEQYEREIHELEEARRDRNAS